MQINTRMRYAVAAMIYIAHNQNNFVNISVGNVADNLGISKIYLEQIFFSLKKAQFISAIKGAQGGYRLIKPSHEITVLEILQPFGLTSSKNNKNYIKKAPEIDAVIDKIILNDINSLINDYLSKITLQDIVDNVNSSLLSKSNMYYI